MSEPKIDITRPYFITGWDTRSHEQLQRVKLTHQARFNGRFYPPGTVVAVPDDLAAELIAKQFAESFSAGGQLFRQAVSAGPQQNRRSARCMAPLPEQARAGSARHRASLGRGTRAMGR